MGGLEGVCACADASSGGLVVYNTSAPPEWHFEQFNFGAASSTAQALEVTVHPPPRVTHAARPPPRVTHAARPPPRVTHAARPGTAAPLSAACCWGRCPLAPLASIWLVSAAFSCSYASTRFPALPLCSAVPCRAVPCSWATAQELLAANGGAHVNVAYRQNRAVLFDSTLFHRSATNDDASSTWQHAMRFKPGYTNRRINLSLLFGKKGDACTPPADAVAEPTAASAAAAPSA